MITIKHVIKYINKNGNGESQNFIMTCEEMPEFALVNKWRRNNEEDIRTKKSSMLLQSYVIIKKAEESLIYM